jgi:flagellar FliL protein
MADEKKEKSEDGGAEGGGGGASGNRKKLLIFGSLGLLLVTAIGGGAAFFLSHSKPPVAAEDPEGVHEAAPAEAGANQGHEGDTHKTDAKGDGHGKPEKPKKDDVSADKTASAEKKPVEGEAEDLGIDFGQTYLLQPFHLNLGNPLENRYARLEVSIEYKGGSTQKAELERRLPQLRDAVVSIVSRKTREFLLAPDGKDQLRKEVKTRLNRYMSKPIEAVYITDILIE